MSLWRCSSPGKIRNLRAIYDRSVFFANIPNTAFLNTYRGYMEARVKEQKNQFHVIDNTKVQPVEVIWLSNLKLNSITHLFWFGTQ